MEHRLYWSTPRNARPGDLILYYKTQPNRVLDDAWEIRSEVAQRRAGYKHGYGFFANIRKVCDFKAPIHLDQLREHPILGTAGFIRGHFRTGFNVTADWHQLYHLLVQQP